MRNFKEIEKIYNGIDRLMDDYADLPETLQAYRDAMAYLKEHKMPPKIEMKVDDLLLDIAYKNERQGFLYGFQYAIRLLIGEGGAEACQ